MPLLLLALGGFGFWLWYRRQQSASPGASTDTASTAAQLNVVLLGGTAAQKQAAIMSYEKSKGLPVDGIYTVAIQHAMQDDGVANPAPLPASVTED